MAAVFWWRFLFVLVFEFGGVDACVSGFLTTASLLLLLFVLVGCFCHEKICI